MKNNSTPREWWMLDIVQRDSTAVIWNIWLKIFTWKNSENNQNLELGQFSLSLSFILFFFYLFFRWLHLILWMAINIWKLSIHNNSFALSFHHLWAATSLKSIPSLSPTLHIILFNIFVRKNYFPFLFRHTKPTEVYFILFYCL